MAGRVRLRVTGCVRGRNEKEPNVHKQAGRSNLVTLIVKC